MAMIRTSTARFAFLALLGAALAGGPPPAARAAEAISEQDAHAIGVAAYTYLYSLVTMDLTRRQLTNVAKAEGISAPMNAFANVPAFPTADMRVVVRPNFDTLYSSAWLDLTKEPMIVSVPDTHGRYYLLPMLDMWTDVFASPGWRTTGTQAGDYAVVPPGWSGSLPAGVVRIDAPTPYVWIIGRTKTDGPADYAAVHEIQAGFKISPLEGGTASGGDGSWHAQGNDGGTASGGDGSWHAQGAEGGTASGGDGSWHADGAYGGTAQGGGGSWTATSPYGATAYHNDNYYGGAYSTYHPPTTVNYYNNTCGGCGGWGAAGAAAAGMAVGATPPPTWPVPMPTPTAMRRRPRPIRSAPSIRASRPAAPPRSCVASPMSSAATTGTSRPMAPTASTIGRWRRREAMADLIGCKRTGFLTRSVVAVAGKRHAWP